MPWNPQILINPTEVKLICKGCLKETMIDSGIIGSTYRRRCDSRQCRGETKPHVVRPRDFKVQAFKNPFPLIDSEH